MEGIFQTKNKEINKVQCIFCLILVDDRKVIDGGTLKKGINEVQCTFQSGFSDDERVIDEGILKVFQL